MGTVQVGNDQEERNQKTISTPNTEVGKTKLTIRYLYHENILSRMSSYFPNR